MVKVDKGGKEFIFCDYAKSNFTFRSDAAQRWLESQNGGIRANPPSRRVRANPSGDGIFEPYVCGTCRGEVQEGVERCPNGHELNWPEEAKENPQEVEEDTNEAMLREVEENKLKLEMWRRLNGGD